MFKKLLPVALSTAVALAATTSGAAHAVDPRIEAAVKVINPDATVHSVRALPGLEEVKEVTADSSVVYMDSTGRYLFFGTLLDLEEKRNLSEEAQAVARRLALDAIPDSEKIIYAPSNVLHRVVVFTDISCTYCQRLHQRVADYNDRGIAIEYVAFPRGGEQNPAWEQMRSIWCAADPKAAYDAAVAGQAPEGGASCSDPVDSHYALGEALDVRGTPALFTSTGRLISGFMEPDRLLVTLERFKQEDAAQATAAAGSR